MKVLISKINNISALYPMTGANRRTYYEGDAIQIEMDNGLPYGGTILEIHEDHIVLDMTRPNGPTVTSKIPYRRITDLKGA